MNNRFTSHLATVDNIELELKNTATKHQLNINSLDFRIKDVITTYKKNNSAEWESIANDYSIFYDYELLESNEFQITQKYQIEIFPKVANKSLSLQFGMGTNPVNTKAVIVIKKESIIVATDTLYEDINSEINKLKLKKGIFINIWDNEQLEGVQTIVDEIIKFGKLQKDHRFAIVNVAGYQDAVDDKVIEHYKIENEVDENSDNSIKANDKVDHFNRGFIFGVVEGQLLLEYIKPKDGVAGKDFHAKHIEAVFANVSNAPAFVPTSNIRVEESDEKIKFYAQKKGFISFDNGKLDVEETLDMNKLDMKSTGHIKAGIDTGIGIHIIENDPLKDAIGTGMVIEVGDIEIKGNIAGDTKLISRTLKIDGQTHIDTYLECDEATIKIHKGKLYTKNATIERFENGFIDADEVTINDMIGGEVRANKIKILNLKKNCTLISNTEVVIDAISGDDNTIILTPLARVEDKKQYESDIKYYNDLEDKLKFIVSHAKESADEYKKVKQNYVQIVKRLKEYKSKGVQYPKMVILEYKKYKVLVEQLEKKQNIVEDELKELKELKNKFNSIQNRVLDAKVIKDTSWGKYYTKIIFELVSSKSEIEYQPHNSDKLISLIIDEDEKYKVSVK